MTTPTFAEQAVHNLAVRGRHHEAGVDGREVALLVASHGGPVLAQLAYEAEIAGSPDAPLFAAAASAAYRAARGAEGAE